MGKDFGYLFWDDYGFLVQIGNLFCGYCFGFVYLQVGFYWNFGVVGFELNVGLSLEIEYWLDVIS